MQARTNKHDHLARYFQMAERAPLLEAKEERRLIESFQKGSEAALTKLLASHLRLVLSIAKRYSGRCAAMEDLIGEGNLGLMEAARRFDVGRDNRFSTYASWWVRARVRRYALANRRIVGAPSTRNARKVLSGLRKAQREFTQEEGRSPNRDEVAAKLQVEEKDVAMVEAALSGRDVAIGASSDGTTFDLRDEAPSPEQLTEAYQLSEERRRRIAEAMQQLSAREREILQRRYLGEETVTLAVLGESLGLSRERVRQIEKRAQRKLRGALPQCVA
jgi:RNA polymerase sigma-32 factor